MSEKLPCEMASEVSKFLALTGIGEIKLGVFLGDVIGLEINPLGVDA